MLSIIIPTLNEEQHLPRLLDSIKSQDYTDYEIIVADAGSIDRTFIIATSYGCKVVPGGLPAKGRNEGAKAAKGDILLFLDADVVLSSHFLKNAVAEFAKRNLGVAGFYIKPMDGRKLDAFLYRCFTFFMETTGMFYWAAMAIMASKKIHEKIGGFNEAITFGEDVSYVRGAAKVSRYGYIAQPFYVSMRRYKKDGRITYVKYVVGIFHILFLGPITSKVFQYKFNHYKDGK